ncbi:hypothetical protein B0H13DRAFT_2359535 [Mycena leptocephala]|nr:hypothetical protein B0H13DRAFT_2359535 [Mycena leptocephala]
MSSDEDSESSGDNSDPPSKPTQATRRRRRAELLKELPALIVAGSSDCEQFEDEIAAILPSIGKKRQTKKPKAANDSDDNDQKDPVQTRVNDIAATRNLQGSVTAAVLTEFIVNPPAGQEAREDNGFVILFSGVQGPLDTSIEPHVWDNEVKAAWGQFGTDFNRSLMMTVGEQATQNTPPDQGDIQMMCQMNTDICKHDEHQSARQLHLHITKNVLILEFCSRWSVLSAGEGQTKRQNEYYAGVYQTQADVAPLFAGIPLKQWDELVAVPEHCNKLKSFKKLHRAAITSRNRYMRLYNEFGVLLLLVTAFDGMRLTNSHTTKPYTKVLTRLLQLRSESMDAQDLEDRDAESWAVLALILGEADADLYQRINRFDDDHRANQKFVAKAEYV